MKKLGFTLAEVLITLMILGIIAAMTVPSLIQDTQGKEQVVLMKKGHSMLNQAVTMNYALEQEDFSSCFNKEITDPDDPTKKVSDTNKGVADMLKARLTVIDSDDNNQWVKTQDGLTYYFQKSAVANAACTNTGDIGVGGDGKGNCIDFIISTLPNPEATTYAAAEEELPTAKGTDGNVLTGYYQFYAGRSRVVAAGDTQLIMTTPKVTAIEKSAIDEAAGNNDDD